jgi:ribonucleoside-diphosphate reductase alpha chain
MIELKRHFSFPGKSPYDSVAWKTVKVGDAEVEAPEGWSDTAIEIAATKYFRRRENEKSVRQLFTRVVDTIRKSGESQGYFKKGEGEIFADD